MLWAWLSRTWSGWREALVIVKPETVTAWRRRRFREYWTRRSRSGKPGRPAISGEVRDLIRRMSSANPLWGAPRIVGELGKIGIELPKSTVAKYMVRPRRPLSATWRAFLKNHIKDIVAVDFFVVPTVHNQVLFVFLVLAHERRRVLHFNVTANPTAEWTAQQIVEAFPWDDGPRFLLRDRDHIYGHHFSRRVERMGIEQVVIAAQSPWQNPFVERLVGSIRRECLDHVIVLNERHLRRTLTCYFEYYHRWRTHQGLIWTARMTGPFVLPNAATWSRSSTWVACTITTSGRRPDSEARSLPSSPGCPATVAQARPRRFAHALSSCDPAASGLTIEVE